MEEKKYRPYSTRHLDVGLHKRLKALSVERGESMEATLNYVVRQGLYKVLSLEGYIDLLKH